MNTSNASLPSEVSNSPSRPRSAAARKDVVMAAAKRRPCRDLALNACMVKCESIAQCKMGSTSLEICLKWLKIAPREIFLSLWRESCHSGGVQQRQDLSPCQSFKNILWRVLSWCTSRGPGSRRGVAAMLSQGLWVTLGPIRCTLCVKGSLDPGGSQRTKSTLSPER
eukprot:scaffold1772_cov97-Phaeocystis_antarctica.AAC.1